MQNLTLAVEAMAPCQEVDIVSSGVESLAVAALLSSRGRDVRFCQDDLVLPEQLLIRGSSVNYKAGRLQGGAGVAAPSQRRSELMLICARAGDYRPALNAVAELLYPGQTVFVVDAPLGTAFELSCLVYKLRKRMAFNVIETGPLFDECKFEGRSLEISGLREQVPICGRSVNETRSGLAIGRSLFSGLVPASNVLERGLADSGRILKIVPRLFRLLEQKSASPSLEKEESELLQAVEGELQTLGKVFNVSVPDRASHSFELSEFVDREKQELALSVIETLVLLSDLGSVAYYPVPAIDEIINRSSELLTRDLRSEGRKLSDLGLVGMDVREIIELVNS